MERPSCPIARVLSKQKDKQSFYVNKRDPPEDIHLLVEKLGDINLYPSPI